MSAIASKAIKSTLATRSISDEFSFVVATTPREREREILTSARILCDWLMGWRRKDNSNSSHCIWFLNVDWKSFFLFQQIIVFNNADDVSTLSHLYHLITCYSTRFDLFMMWVWMSKVEKNSILFLFPKRLPKFHNSKWVARTRHGFHCFQNSCLRLRAGKGNWPTVKRTHVIESDLIFL